MNDSFKNGLYRIRLKRIPRRYAQIEKEKTAIFSAEKFDQYNSSHRIIVHVDCGVCNLSKHNTV